MLVYPNFWPAVYTQLGPRLTICRGALRGGEGGLKVTRRA